MLICRKLYTHDLDPAAFLDPAISGSYKDGDYHRMFVGEIVKVLEPLEKLRSPKTAFEQTHKLIDRSK